MKKVKVFDFSSRLPGPLAGYLLATSGLETFKVEDTNFPDPFDDDQMQVLDPIYKVWYKGLNQGKQLIRGDQKFIKQQVLDNLESYNIFLSSNNQRLKTLLGKLPLGKKAVYIEIIAGIGDERYMHDLNAIASVPIFKLHIKQTSLPPFVPIAGVCFAQDIVNKALMALWELESEASEVFRTALLKESTQNIFRPLWDENLSFERQYLHTGLFPCYRIYEARDCKIAIAAVEEKFWIKFTQTFDIPLSSDDRLNSSEEIASIIEQKLKTYQRQDLQKMALGQMCLTII